MYQTMPLSLFVFNYCESSTQAVGMLDTYQNSTQNRLQNAVTEFTKTTSVFQVHIGRGAYTKLLGKRCHRASINATKLTQSRWVFKECETMFFTDSDNTTKKRPG